MSDGGEGEERRCACGGVHLGDGDMVIRRLYPRLPDTVIEGFDTRLGLVIDVETTGLTHTADKEGGTHADEILEFAAVPFTYRPSDGTILGVHAPYSALNKTTRPIPAFITTLTGIDQAMVDAAVAAGTALSRPEVERLVAPASLVLCHHSDFDRRFLENYSEVFAAKPFACTIEDAGWREDEGVESAKLVFIAAMIYRFTYGAHRGLDDCHAVVEILRRTMPKTGVGVLGKILASARRGRRRVRALDTPFACKDLLKARGYRWDPGDTTRPKCWYLEVQDDAAVAEERAFLATISGRIACDVTRLTAFTRFSNRA